MPCPRTGPAQAPSDALEERLTEGTAVAMTIVLPAVLPSEAGKTTDCDGQGSEPLTALLGQGLRQGLLSNVTAPVA